VIFQTVPVGRLATELPPRHPVRRRATREADGGADGIEPLRPVRRPPKQPKGAEHDIGF
jgi:hypothetical protein